MVGGSLLLRDPLPEVQRAAGGEDQLRGQEPPTEAGPPLGANGPGKGCDLGVSQNRESDAPVFVINV